MATFRVIYDPDDRIQVHSDKLPRIRFATLKTDEPETPLEAQTIARNLANLLLEQLTKPE